MAWGEQYYMWKEYLFAFSLMTPVVVMAAIPLCFITLKIWRGIATFRRDWNDAKR